MVVPVGLTISALTVAIVALVLYILQMILGSPKIKLVFDVSELEGGRVLHCKIHNEPIMRGLPRLLRIRRGVADVTGYFSINEQGSNRVVFPGAFPYIVTHTGVKNAQRTILAASAVPVRFGIVMVTYASHEVEVYDQNVALKRGAYQVNVEVAADGELIKAQANFVVSDKHPFAYLS